ncbi:MAG: hypothetical protein A2W25_14270 [candidate division Zixibacteria bacterium RBG_16_53_22]|nr:MAG: hypothetical protein A2W25_14270 [candidate division Zixibacteria bacterium RBG_16_53_22]
MHSNFLTHLKSGKSLNILGINSGTSADGIDMALCRFATGKPRIISCATRPFGHRLTARIISAGEPNFNNGVEWLRLDAELGEILGENARRFINRAARLDIRIDLIAVHGQTVRHLPDNTSHRITYQVGDAARVARITGLPVITDFRRSDIAAGGEGAPLSPILHEALFRHRSLWRAIVNIGGISNVTVLPPFGSKSRPFAADCGPGNMLTDRAVQNLYGKAYDRGGKIALSGGSRPDVVRKFLADPYFLRKPPKSTGREYFGEPYLEKVMRQLGKASPEDIVATLTEITVGAMADFLSGFCPRVEEIYLCGGGAHNKAILGRLRSIIPNVRVSTTTDLKYDPDYLEALLWAYLAWRFMKRQPVSARGYTGAKKPYIPGRLCLP